MFEFRVWFGFRVGFGISGVNWGKKISTGKNQIFIVLLHNWRFGDGVDGAAELGIGVGVGAGFGVWDKIGVEVRVGL